MADTTSKATILVRPPDSIYEAGGRIENGTFQGRWHFSFDQYTERDYSHFGSLRVFNDDTLSPGARWPLHHHRNIEVVTYCAGGVFRHADERGPGGILKKGWVQHTTVGCGISHAEINDSNDAPMRFIQMWFLPSETDLEPSVEQKQVRREERTNLLLPLVSNDHSDALPIVSDAKVFASYLESGRKLVHHLGTGRGAYLYILEGGPVRLNGESLPELAAAKIIGGESEMDLVARENTELLLVEVPLAVSNRMGI
ncbi:MAG: pirin family protein [Thermoleophilia bacterium]|nr:pirin family protein [Thermoleophilia bacterium]